MVVVKNRFVVLDMVFSRLAEVYSIFYMLLDLISLVFKSKYQHVSSFPIYKVCAVVQDERIETYGQIKGYEKSMFLPVGVCIG